MCALSHVESVCHRIFEEITTRATIVLERLVADPCVRVMRQTKV